MERWKWQWYWRKTKTIKTKTTMTIVEKKTMTISADFPDLFLCAGHTFYCRFILLLFYFSPPDNGYGFIRSQLISLTCFFVCVQAYNMKFCCCCCCFIFLLSTIMGSFVLISFPLLVFCRSSVIMQAKLDRRLTWPLSSFACKRNLIWSRLDAGLPFCVSWIIDLGGAQVWEDSRWASV